MVSLRLRSDPATWTDDDLAVRIDRTIGQMLWAGLAFGAPLLVAVPLYTATHLLAVRLSVYADCAAGVPLLVLSWRWWALVRIVDTRRQARRARARLGEQ